MMGRKARGWSGRPGAKRAFSLIEVLVTITVVAILATVAYPSYREYMSKSRRADARATLHRVALELERCYSRLRRFNAAAGCDVVSAGPRVQLTSDAGWYQIDSTSPVGVATLAAETFTLHAVPRGAQATDTACALFTLTQAERQQATNSAGQDATTTCW